MFLDKLKGLAIKGVGKIISWGWGFVHLPLKEKWARIKIPVMVAIIVGVVILIGPYFAQPKISVSFPGNNSRENPLDSDVEIIFDRGMNKASVEKSFSITPKVDGALTWESNRKLVFTPKIPLQRGVNYKVKFNGLAVSSFLSPMPGGVSVTFTTVGNPIVSVFSPQSEAVEDLAPVMVIFDRPMIPLTTATNSAEKKSPFEISPPLTGTGKWLGTTAYQFTPLKPFKKATTYTVSVVPNLKSADGGIISQSFSWQFSSLRPHVLSVVPREGEFYASPTASVSAVFNQNIDGASAATHFKLVDTNGNQIPGRVTVNGKRLGFYPAAALVREKIYKAVIMAGLAGKEGPNGTESDYAWSFTMAAKPAVLRSAPADGDKNVENQGISVFFKTPMDEDSFKDNISINPVPENKPNFNFSDWNSQNELNIYSYLFRSTKYTVTIGPKVTDQYGVPLGSAYTFSFTTADYKPSVSFVPFGTYFASFNQQIVPRIVAQVNNAGEVNYNLYKLDRNSFLDLYKRYYTDFCSWNNEGCRNWQNYDVSKLEKVRSWKETIDINPSVPVNVVTKVTAADGTNLLSGFYFLTANVNTGQHDNMVMIVSDATMAVKKSSQQIFTWTVDQTSNEVIGGMNMELTDAYGNKLASGQTNGDGVWQQDVNIGNTYNLLIFGQKDSDVVVASSNWGSGINRYDFGLPSYYSYNASEDNQNSNNRYKLFLTTDRPIYRPGQKIYFKGLIRKDNDAAYANIPPGTPVSVNIADGRGRSIYSKSLPTNSSGTFADTCDISADGELGYYDLTATYGDNSVSQQVQVEEFRRPDMLLTIIPDKGYYLAGQTPGATINTAYYFGAPMANAQVNWSLNTQDYFFNWSRDWRFEFGDVEDIWYRWWGYHSSSGAQVTSGTGVTDDQGNLNLKIPFNMGKYTTSQQLELVAQVTDKSNQAVGSSQTFVVHQGGIYAGLHPESYGSSAGSETKVEVVTVAPDENEVPNTAVTIQFFKRTWNTVRQLDPESGQFTYVSQPHDTQVANANIITDNFGHATTSFTPGEGGTYRVLASVTDALGNTTKTSSYVWVSGSGYMTQRENNDRILVVPDKREYFVGDNASVFVDTPFATGSAKTLLTVERSKVISYKIVDTSDVSNNFQMPINPNYSPNIYIGAVLVKGGNLVSAPPEMKVGYAEVKVTDKKQQLTVDIQTDKPKYKPGETMHAVITAKDLLGHPVNAELAVGLVDKSVWDLSEIQLPDIYQYFYVPRNLEVDTSHLLSISMDRINTNTNLGAKGGSGGCFTAETPILLPGGLTKPIGEIKPGDRVLTKSSPESADLIPGKVTAVLKHSVDRYLIINGSIHVTPVHLLFVNGNWKAAGEIQTGDWLLNTKNEPVRVNSVEQVFGKDLIVYNLEVDQYHTFFADGIFVHNQKGGGTDTARNNFPETAYWNPSILTGDDGKADITVKLPDNLTTWRLSAIADSRESAFGSATDEFVVNREVMIRPVIPRFLLYGDQASLGAIIVNTSGKSAVFSTTLSGKGLTVNANSVQTATIADGDQAKFLWPTTTAGSTDSATINISVTDQSGTLHDSLVQTLPVKSFSTGETVATAGQAADTAVENVKLPSVVESQNGRVDITLSPSLGTGSIEAANYMYDYSYFCTEQTTSKLLTAVSALKVLRQAKTETLGSVSQMEMNWMANDAIQRLNNTQRPDGGWGWWTEESSSDPMMSAYAYLGLWEAKNAGFTVADKTLNPARQFLLTSLSGNYPTIGLDGKTFLLYALKDSGANLSAYATNLYDRRFEMGVASRAYLAMVLRASKLSDAANKQYQEVLSLAKKTSTTSHWEESGRNYYYWYYGANPTTAAVLEMMTDFAPNNPMTGEAVRYLMANRGDYNWGSTQQTALIMRAITKQMLAGQNANLKENYKLEINNREVLSGQLTAADLLRLVKFSVPISSLAIGQNNTFKISKSGSGNLYYNFNMHYFLPFSQIAALDQGLVIIREFTDDQGNSLPLETIREGTQASVKLTVVAPATRQFVIIEDMLPAGLEAVNESLKNVVNLNKSNPILDEPDNWWYFYHREYRDDRTTMFARYLPAGIYTVTYQVRATTPGKYHYPPAQAHEMYFPDVSGHSDGGWLTVIPNK